MSGAITFTALSQDTALLVGPSGQPLARYSWGAASNHPYFDELRPLTHRGVLTTHAPHDHRWHHGLWWSWKFLNDVLFWEDHPNYGGNRGGLGRSAVTDHAVRSTADGVEITERLTWYVEATEQVLLSEQRTVTATTDTGLEHGWALDFDQTWTATSEVHLSVTPWPEITWGGYAGLNYRAARAMRTGETITGAGDRRGREAIHGQRLPWASYGGAVDGAGDDEPDHPARGSVAFLQHPGDDAVPDPFYVFSAAEDFGFLATAPLMHAGRTLRQGEQVRRRTRVLVLDRPAGTAELDHAHTTYAHTISALTTSAQPVEPLSSQEAGQR